VWVKKKGGGERGKGKGALEYQGILLPLFNLLMSSRGQDFFYRGWKSHGGKEEEKGESRERGGEVLNPLCSETGKM